MTAARHESLCDGGNVKLKTEGRRDIKAGNKEQIKFGPFIALGRMIQKSLKTVVFV